MTLRWPGARCYGPAPCGHALALLAPQSLPPLRWPRLVPRPEAAVNLGSSARSSPLTRLSPVAVAVYCMVFPLGQIGVVLEAGTRREYGHAAWALAASAAYAPIYLRHVLYFIRGLRPPGALWSLAALAGIIGGALPLAGGGWLPSFFALAVALLITLPWQWSLPGVAVLTAAQVPLALALATLQPAAAYYFPATLLWRTAAVFVPVLLARTVRQLDSARRELAQDAVLRERARLDARLRLTLGTALASIVAGGQRSARLAGADPPAAGRELAALAQTSRTTLADARRLLSGLHQPPLDAELETAASLLTAAGIPTRLALPAGDEDGGGLPARASAAFRAELQSATARLLRDEGARACLISVTAAGGQLRLAVLVSDTGPAALEVPAS